MSQAWWRGVEVQLCEVSRFSRFGLEAEVKVSTSTGLVLLGWSFPQSVHFGLPWDWCDDIRNSPIIKVALCFGAIHCILQGHL